MSDTPASTPASGDDLPLSTSVYLRLRGLPATQRRRRRRIVDPNDENVPFSPGRDPKGLGDIVADLTRESGWTSSLAREDLVLQWEDVAGAETAAHATPVSLTDGVLVVRCDSTAWMKNLSMLRGQILTRIITAHPDAKVESIRFIGPDVPSWKWGPRVAPGRGPRDTYG